MTGTSPAVTLPPSWFRDIEALVSVLPFFVLTGNVRDRYLLPFDDMPLADDLPMALARGFERSGFDVTLLHDPIDGYRVLGSAEEAASWAAVHAATGLDLRDASATDLTVLRSVVDGVSRNATRRVALVLDYAGRLVGDPEHLEPTERAFFLAALKCSHTARTLADPDAPRPVLHNPVVWIIEREQELPAWFMAGNAAVRHIPVPLPDLDDRTRVARLLLGEEAADSRVDALAGSTEGLPLSNLFDVLTLRVDQDLDAEDLDGAVRRFKMGGADSPWQRGAIAERLRSVEVDGEAVDAERFLTSRVLGQPRAIVKATDILKRSVFGLSGAQASRVSSRPRGVLFLAGPTGVGKTELAKAITELVFGTEDAYVRFDMSEFSAEQAGDRLIGAPPGYVGFDAGGELTNAIRRRPHSLVLFDEIEKAHFRILDKFLQILDEGRLTDARGVTVHFSESIIVFTSNLGVTGPPEPDGTRRTLVSPADGLDVIESRLRSEILRYFTEDLNRPELLNRVGENVIVFDFIRPDVADLIFEGQIRRVTDHVLRASEIRVEISDTALETLRRHATADLSFGGRGIGNLVEATFVNPLARLLFEQGSKPGDRIWVDSAVPDARPPVLLT